MLKQSLFALALSFSTLACSHSAMPRKFTPPSMTAIRLDEAIRSKCDTTSSVSPVFDFSSSEVSEETKGTLDSVATCFKSGPLKGKSLRLIGFTDPRGTRAENYELGLERARSVADYLESRGMKRSQIIASSRGEEGASPDKERWSADRIVDMSIAN
ncbi:MAG: OmpA family protein [Archangium sp.]|nr:OmpA family protein [Archangium sp.]